MNGKMLPKDKMYMMTYVASLIDGDSGYDVLLNASSGIVIESAVTLKRFQVPWQEMIAAARAAGIDEVADELS